MHPRHDLAHIVGSTQRELHVNAPNHEDTIFILDFPSGIGGQTSVARIDFARFQRATKGA